MTPDLRIQQAIVLTDARGVRVVAQTDAFDLPEAERIAVMFGARPAGVACVLAHFACPFGKKHVAVVRVEDRPAGALGFRFLVLARELYQHLGDPFAIADRYPPNWTARGRLADLAWPMEVLPERTLEELLIGTVISKLCERADSEHFRNQSSSIERLLDRVAPSFRILKPYLPYCRELEAAAWRNEEANEVAFQQRYGRSSSAIEELCRALADRCRSLLGPRPRTRSRSHQLTNA